MEKHYNFSEFEKKAQKIWEDNQTYKQELKEPIYSIDTPPPTVSGSLHIGHIFSYTQADIIARYKRMSGFNVLYPMGFDDNGLATERYVEKKLGIQSQSLSREEFIVTCLTEIKPAEEDFESLFKSIGLSIDWTKKYSTINQSSRKISQLSFIKLYEKGLAYRKAEPAIYCTMCKTTISQADLEDAEKKSCFNDILFEIPAHHRTITISTTRPELLSSVVAILYHPNDVRYKDLKDLKAIVPIYGHKVPILPDTDVDPEKGTGIVMVSTFGDKQDIIWAKKYNFEYKQAIGRDGLMTPLTGPLQGIYANDGRKKIIALLKDQNLLTGQKDTQHTVNVHERCKREVEYLIFPQWFLQILPHKDKFVSLANDINWYPQFMKSRYVNWVENLTWDWCLSRQRFYGIPFPLWYCKDCNEILLADAKDLPVDPQTQRYPRACTKCGSTKIEPETDVMDTWNTSSLTPYICSELVKESLGTAEQEVDVFESNKLIPMSMRPQAHDIIRTWAFYTIVKSYFHSGTIPWKDIVISGHVLSTEKEKISKSKGNNPLEPKNLLERYPADAIRYWTATGTLGYDTAFSEGQISIGNRLLTKLWNAFKFTNEYLCQGFQETHTPEINSLTNKWILVTLKQQFVDYKKSFDNYEYAHALDKIDRFFWHSFCDNYLELIKDQLFNQTNYKPEDVYETLWTLKKLGLAILQMYAPFIPHITESLYQIVYNPGKTSSDKSSIHITQFEAELPDISVEKYLADATMMNKILDIISLIRKHKSESKLSLKTDIERLTLYTTDIALEQTLRAESNLIKGIARAKNIEFAESAESKIYQENELWYIDLVS